VGFILVGENRRPVTSYMNDREFVDTNILIYAHDLDAGERHLIAADKLNALWERRAGVLSMQVLQEFYVNITRKIARPLTKADISAAFRIEDEARISFWDAMICASALRAGTTVLLSEDLNPGQRIAGIEIVNPFKKVKPS
jgi:predicted nucleic acid-binding protein